MSTFMGHMYVPQYEFGSDRVGSTALSIRLAAQPYR